jgi:HAE1 family hydrophobic/amphiphilic exporter-1
VIENISRHAEEGAPAAQAAHAGTKEIALAVLAVTLAILAVFVPVAFMEGLVGRFFSAFGITVAVAVALSYFVSMTLTPMASALVLRAAHGEPGRVSRAIEGALAAVERVYRRVLVWALDHRRATIAIAVATLVATVALGRFLQFTFIPSQDMSEVKVTLELPVGTPLERTARELEALRQQLAAVPGVTGVFATAGGGVQEEVNKGELLVTLVPIRDRAYGQQDLKAWLRANLRRPADAQLAVQDFALVAGGGSRPQPVQFNLRGHDWNEVVASAEKVRAHMAQSPLFSDVDSSYRAGKPQMSVRVDRDRAAALGIPAAVIGQSVRGFLGGDDFAKFREGADTYDIRLKLPRDRRGADRLGELTVRGAQGQLVELRNVAAIREDASLSQIDRQSRLRQITLVADLPKGASLGAAMQDLSAFAAKELPATVITDFEGQGKELGKTAKAFLQALLLGIVLVYMILAAQFGSLLDPLTIMASLPFAVIGALGALLAGGQFMSMFAMIGMIMLMGLVTKNGILLVEFTNQLKERGRSTREALLEAGPIRLRPILMTTIAMIAGMIPVALARGDGAEMRVPMAIAIIGGLVSSTVLTLVVVPVFYSLLERLKRRRRLEVVDAASAPQPTGT